MNNQFKMLPLLKKWQHYLYLLSLVAFLIALPTSVAVINVTAVAMVVVWVLTGNYKEKWQRLINNKDALLLMTIPLVYLLGLPFAQDVSQGLQQFNKSLPWLIMGFVLGSSAPISKKETSNLLLIYIGAVVLSASFAIYALLFLENIHFQDYREVTLIDHIPFSFQMGFAVWLILYLVYSKKYTIPIKGALLLIALSLVCALVALKSFNGYLYFGIMSLTAFSYILFKIKVKWLKWSCLVLIISLVTIPAIYLYNCIKDFYDTPVVTLENIDWKTAQGNSYVHPYFQGDHSKENGNYTMLYVCEEELIEAWNARSSRSYNSLTKDGYCLGAVIMRYMTSKGLRKDAEGMAQLSDSDIVNIENEIPNYIFANKNYSIYPRIYETIWEIDQYMIYENPTDKSLAMRIEMAKVGALIAKENLLLGIGLGNTEYAYIQKAENKKSRLALPPLSSHNQYLNYIIQFGILGMLYIMAVLFLCYYKGVKKSPFIIHIFFISMIVANFGDANWETVIGLHYFAFFMGFFMWIAPKEHTLSLLKGND